MNAVRPTLRRSPIRLRVALMATLLAFTALAAVMYQHVTDTSETFDQAARQQTLTVSEQVGRATAGAGSAVIGVIPFAREGLDGMTLFSPDGSVQGTGGPLGPPLADLHSLVARARAKGKPVQEYRVVTGGGKSTRPAKDGLSPWSPTNTIIVTAVPLKEGTLVTGYRVDWATTRLRSSAISTGLSLLAGALVIVFGLMLLLGRLVTRPLERLAADVRGLSTEGHLLTAQSSPELQALADDIAALHDELVAAMRQSATDPLTGLANHRGFQERLSSAITHADETGDSLALIALDLDHLKAVNDRYGHGAGDRMIAALARALEMGSAGGELGARVGGDEFTVVCPGADREAASAVGAQIAAWFARVPRTRLTDDGSECEIEPSVSWGVAVWPEDGRTKDELIQAADAALYVAKRARGTRERRSGDQIEQSVRVLAAAIDARDEGTGAHSVYVADIAGDVARTLGFGGKQIAALRRAALLHDSGKLALPDTILQKPAPLDAVEHTLMREHSDRGYEIAVAAGLPDHEALWIRHVHEHFDGSGYPSGSVGDEIPLESRILLVADAYSAMTHDRPYQDACSPADALAEIRRCSGTQFDPRVVAALTTAVEPFTGLTSDDAVPV